MDTFIVFAASYDTLDAAEAGYHAVHDFYLTSGLLDRYDAAVITKDDAGQVRIVVKHGQPTRLGDLGEVIKRASSLTRRPPDQSLQEAVAESEAAVQEAEREAEAAERAAERYSTFGSRPATRDDLASQLDDLARLHEKGALSQAEFEAAKSRLLSG